MKPSSSDATAVSAWRTRVRAMRACATPDRIVAVFALALIPCMLFSWAHVPVGKAAGFDVSFSVPDALDTGIVAVGYAEDLQELADGVRNAIEYVSAFIDKGEAVVDRATEIVGSADGASRLFASSPESEGEGNDA